MPTAVTGAEYVITRVGGLTRTASLLTEKTGERVPVTTVQGWRDRGRIPQPYWMYLVDLAEENNLPVTLADFLMDHPINPDEIAEAGSASAIAG